MDKEFIGWLHSKSWCQRLDVQMETGDEQQSLGVGTGTDAVSHPCQRHGEQC